MKPATVLLLLLVLFMSCQTTPNEIPDGLSQAELVQLAQESADNESWDAAIAYYAAVLARFPQDRAASATAQYEIAFIEYKRGNTQAAVSGFEQLLGFYDFEGDSLPQWPRVLGEKLLAQIREEETESTAEG